jgi:translin
MSSLEEIAENIREDLKARDEAREKTLHSCREAIRYCSTSIRALHRHEFEQSERLLFTARELIEEGKKAAGPYMELASAGYVRDAEKEYVEGSMLLTLVTGMTLPSPSDLGVEAAPYLKGLGEAGTELRRYLLDGIRRGDLSQSESILAAMDDIYNVLVTMDFPDALTGGLRRTTDNVRGVLEKTRSDLTLITRQKELETKLDSITKSQS